MANINMSSPPTSGIQYIVPRQAMFAAAPVILQAPASARRGLDRHQLSSMKALSIVQLLCGTISIVFDVVLLMNADYFGFTSGIWCGVFFLVAGILGVVGAAQNKKSLFIGTMVMSILSSIVLFVIIGFHGNFISYCNRRDYHFWNVCDNEEYVFAFGGVLILNSTVELIASIWASVLCCKGVCGVNAQLGTPYTSQPVYYTVQHSTGEQLTVLPPNGVTITPSTAFMPVVHQNQNTAYYPQQQLAVGNANYAEGAAGPPPYSK